MTAPNMYKVLNIFRKDVREAVRDARVLMAVLFPLGLGLFYNVIFPDEEDSLPGVTVAYAAPDEPRFLGILREAVQSSVDLTLRREADADAVRVAVDDDDAGLGLIVPAGFDAAVESGAAPELTVVRPDSLSTGANLVAASLDTALRQLAGQSPPATLRVEAVGEEQTNAAEAIIEELGLARWMVLTMAIFLVGMIGLYAVPVILTEETEKRTLEALTLVASYPEVIIAKALVGLLYVAVGLTLLIALTGLNPAEPVAFAAGFVLLALSLVGLGLLMGGLFRTVTQLNTWSSFILLAITFPAFFTGFPVPDVVEWVLFVWPSWHAVRLAVDSTTASEVFGNPWLSYLTLSGWVVLAYLLVWWRLARREI